MNGEHMSPESVVRFICRFCSDDVMRPSLQSPWLSNGMCYATDGRIAIRTDPGFAPVGGFKRGDYGRYRIWCHGTGFDILLMAIRSDRMDAHGISVADSVTATLVHSISDDSFVSFAHLQFGGAE
jgi:hypothetical protein